MEQKISYDHMVAFSIGYYDGRTQGIENNTFSDAQREFYDSGFQRGVADYEEFDLDDDYSHMTNSEADADVLSSAGMGVDEDYGYNEID
jgi:hypothetical protein